VYATLTTPVTVKNHFPCQSKPKMNSNQTSQIAAAAKPKTNKKLVFKRKTSPVIATLKEKVASLEAQLKAKNSELDSMAKLCSAKTNELSDLCEKNSLLDATVEELKDENSQLVTKNVQLAAQLAEAKNSLATRPKNSRPRKKKSGPKIDRKCSPCGKFTRGMMVEVVFKRKDNQLARIEQCNTRQAKLIIFKHGFVRSEDRSDTRSKQEKTYSCLKPCEDQVAAKAKLEQLAIDAKAIRAEWIQQGNLTSFKKELAKWSMKHRYKYLNENEELDGHRNSKMFGELKYFFKYKHNIDSRRLTMGTANYAQLTREQTECDLGQKNKCSIVLDAITKMKAQSKIRAENKAKLQSEVAEKKAAAALAVEPADEQYPDSSDDEPEIDTLALFNNC
jgi:hypothetical protein